MDSSFLGFISLQTFFQYLNINDRIQLWEFLHPYPNTRRRFQLNFYFLYMSFYYSYTAILISNDFSSFQPLIFNPYFVVLIFCTIKTTNICYVEELGYNLMRFEYYCFVNDPFKPRKRALSVFCLMSFSLYASFLG